MCQVNLVFRGDVMPDEEVQELDALEREAVRIRKKAGRSVAWAAAPCVRLCGPLLPIVGADDGCAHPLGVGNRWHNV